MKNLSRSLAVFYLAFTAPGAWASDVALSNRLSAGPDAPAAAGGPLWIFLNSPLGLWFLSSVVLAGITTGYTRYQKSQKERTKRTTTQNRLNIEISSRIANAIVALRLDQKRINNGMKYWASAMYNEAVHYLDNRFAGQDGKVVDFSVYREYQTRRFRPLIVELNAIAPPSMSTPLREAQAAYTRLEELADETPLQEDYSKEPDGEKTIAAIRDSCALLEKLQRHRFWQAPV